MVIEITGPAESIVNVFERIGSTFPALSVAWNCSEWAPSPETVNGPEYVVQPPESSRYSIEPMPEPPKSLPESVTVVGPR